MTRRLPTPEQQILLGLTPVRDRRPGATEVAALLAQADPGGLAALFARHGVLGVHGQRLRTLAPGSVGPELSRRIDDEITTTGVHAVVLDGVLSNVLTMLADAGIPALALKGPRLAEAAHGDQRLRPSRDLDVLVTSADLERASQHLQGAGFAPPRDRLRSNGLPDLHLGLEHPQSWGPEIELHWRVHWADAAHAQDVLDRATSDSDGFLRANPADELAILLLCYARDGFIGVRLASDLAGWWDNNGDALQSPALADWAAAYPRLEPALAAAATVAEAVAGIPADRLLSVDQLRRASRLAVRTVDPLALGSEPQLRAQLALVEWATLPRRELPQFVARRMDFPRAASGLQRWLHIPKLAARALLTAMRPPPDVLGDPSAPLRNRT